MSPKVEPTSQAMARRSQEFLAIRDIRIPHISRMIAIMLVITVAGTVCFLAFVPWIQTTSGRGQVTTLDPRDREQPINALVSGRIQQWFVRDGSRVEAGAPILRIVDNDPKLVERLTAERAALEQQLAAARAATRTARLDYERRQRLYDQGLASRLDLEQARIKVEDLRAKEAAAEAELSRADVSISRQSLQVVRAPRKGTIVSVSAGDQATFVREGQQVATFLPDGGVRAVEAYIDGRDISLVTEGRKVRLQFEGFPAVQISGWPTRAVGTFGGEVAFVDPAANLNGQFRVLVTRDPEDDPWPPDEFIRFGSKARAWILLDKVKVGYELWRRLNNFPPNFLPPATRSGTGESGGSGL